MIDEKQIEEAIKHAKPGIKQYLQIMRRYSETNTANDFSFQKKYKAFYRIRRPEKWDKVYFGYMEDLRKQDVNFRQVLNYFKVNLNRYEPSFTSKLIATHNPNKPIWDRYVLQNIGLTAPSYGSKYKFERAEETYQKICDWYAQYEDSPECKLIIQKFDVFIPDCKNVTNTKKIDFVLWQIRE